LYTLLLTSTFNTVENYNILYCVMFLGRVFVEVRSSLRFS